MKNIYTTFEFNLIKERLLKHATVELAKNYVNDLEMFDSKDDLAVSLSYLNEAIRYANKYGRLNIYYHPNLIPNSPKPLGRVINLETKRRENNIARTTIFLVSLKMVRLFFQYSL